MTGTHTWRIEGRWFYCAAAESEIRRYLKDRSAAKGNQHNKKEEA